MKSKRRMAASPFSVGRVQQPVNGIDWSRAAERGYLWQLIKLLSRVRCVEPRVVPQISARRRRCES